jgi:hypothetical protein
MPEIDWDKIADNTQKSTDEFFKSQISSLTSLTDSEVLHLINEIGISKENLIQVLKVVDDAGQSNEAKANAIQGISKGVNILVDVASRFLI